MHAFFEINGYDDIFYGVGYALVANTWDAYLKLGKTVAERCYNAAGASGELVLKIKDFGYSIPNDINVTSVHDREFWDICKLVHVDF